MKKKPKTLKYAAKMTVYEKAMAHAQAHKPATLWTGKELVKSMQIDAYMAGYNDRRKEQQRAKAK